MDITLSMTETTGIFALADEILIQILELMSIGDIMACSLVNSRFNAVAKAACVPFRNALARYDLQYSPPYQISEREPCLAELLYTLLELHHRWLVLSPTKTENVVIADSPDDILFYEQFAVVDRQPDEEEDEVFEPGWALEVLTFGETPNGGEAGADANDAKIGEDGQTALEVDIDGAVIEEITDITGIDLEAVETEDVDDDGDLVVDDGSEEGGAESVVLENRGVHSIAEFKTASSNLNTYKVDTRQDLVITSEEWRKAKAKKSARFAQRGGLNFARGTNIIRCLTLAGLRPHPNTTAHLGAINVHSLCVENKEEAGDPIDLVIQGPLLAFTVRHTLRDKVVIINWREPLRTMTITLETEFYMDKLFIAPDLLALLVCPISQADIARRSLDEMTWFSPIGGRLKVHLYYLGPSTPNRSSPQRLRTLLLPTLHPNTRLDIETITFMPQMSDVTSRPPPGGPHPPHILRHRAKDEAGVVALTFTGSTVKDDGMDDLHEEIPEGDSWVMDVVVLKSHLLRLARDPAYLASGDKEIPFEIWGGRHARLFPHLDAGVYDSPKLHTTCTYRVVSINPLVSPDGGIPEVIVDGRLDQGGKRQVPAADRRMDVLDFCPGRIEDVREALEWEKHRAERNKEFVKTELVEPISFGPEYGGGGPGTDHYSAKLATTLVDTPTVLEKGVFVEAVETYLPYLISKFDLERGRRDDGELPLPEAVFLSEVDLIVQVQGDDNTEEFECPRYDRYLFI